MRAGGVDARLLKAALLPLSEEKCTVFGCVAGPRLGSSSTCYDIVTALLTGSHQTILLLCLSSSAETVLSSLFSPHWRRASTAEMFF